MRFRDTLQLIVIVAILQLVVGIALYGFIGAAPSVDWSGIGIAIALMVVVSISVATVMYWVFRRYTTERTIKVAMMALSEDERLVFKQIVSVGGGVRQDDLRRQLHMSKSKLSALVNNLEHKKAIVKTRFHKTNMLKPTKEFGGQ